MDDKNLNLMRKTLEDSILQLCDDMILNKLQHELKGKRKLKKKEREKKRNVWSMNQLKRE